MNDSADMPDTMWSMIARARQDGGRAFDDILRKYRPPVLAFIRKAGYSPEEAEDFAQEVFLTFVRDDLLARADRSRGRFRSFLIAVIRHRIGDKLRRDGRLKRGGDRIPVPFHASSESAASPPIEELVTATEADPDFDSLWVNNLVRLGMNSLREECEREGTPYFEALLLHTDEELDYAAVAQRLGASVSNVRNYIHRARLRLKRHVLREMQAYSSSREEYDAEVAYLTKFLE